MKIKLNPKSRGLWFCLLCVVFLISLLSIEFGVLYPQAKRYFDNTGSFYTSRQLASRSRRYLVETLEIISESKNLIEDKKHVEENLDLAYSFLDVAIYLNQYPCTATALEKIDSLDRQLQQLPVDLELYMHTMIPVLRCSDTIEMAQNKKRSTLALNMANTLNYHQKILMGGLLCIVVMGGAFSVLHFKQRNLLKKKREEAQKWIHHAMRDGLTGILNRRAFDEDLTHYVNKYKQSGNLFSLLMCDIDYFKQYNDTMGHPAGDKILQKITRELLETLRERDRLYRYGGEELIILLDKTDKKQAQTIGIRVLDYIRDLQLTHPGSELGYLTISVGCGDIDEVNGVSKSIVDLVDARLYKAKQAGRNCLVHE